MIGCSFIALPSMTAWAFFQPALCVQCKPSLVFGVGWKLEKNGERKGRVRREKRKKKWLSFFRLPKKIYHLRSFPVSHLRQETGICWHFQSSHWLVENISAPRTRGMWAQRYNSQNRINESPFIIQLQSTFLSTEGTIVILIFQAIHTVDINHFVHNF